jgi:hypothetical protein
MRNEHGRRGVGALCQPAPLDYVEEKIRLTNLRMSRGSVSRREKLYVRQGGLCFHCGARMWLLSRKRKHKFNSRLKNMPYVATVEHLLPVSKGGTDAWSNIVAACFKCNHQRLNMDIWEFRLITEIAQAVAAI